MKKSASLLLIFSILLFTACGGAKSDKTESTETAEPTESTEAPEPMEEPAELSEEAKAIDAENAAMIKANEDNFNKIYVDQDGSMAMSAAMRLDHRIFGYAQPDTTATRLFLYSVFTNDVDGNPYGLKLGAYYDTYGHEGSQLIFKADEGDFIKAHFADENGKETALYFQKKWVVFD